MKGINMANLNCIGAESLVKGINEAAEKAKREVTDIVALLDDLRGESPKLITEAQIALVGTTRFYTEAEIGQVGVRLDSRSGNEIWLDASGTKVKAGSYRVLVLVHRIES
jgi:hypothetical protein